MRTPQPIRIFLSCQWHSSAATFFPVDRMPAVAKYVMYMVPLTHTNILIRKASFDHEGAVSLAVSCSLRRGVLCLWDLPDKELQRVGSLSDKLLLEPKIICHFRFEVAAEKAAAYGFLISSMLQNATLSISYRSNGKWTVVLAGDRKKQVPFPVNPNVCRNTAAQYLSRMMPSSSFISLSAAVFKSSPGET